jgi:hypothetical protein
MVTEGKGEIRCEALTNIPSRPANTSAPARLALNHNLNSRLPRLMMIMDRWQAFL